MDPYAHPSAIPDTPKERSQQQQHQQQQHLSGAAASSSSSNFDPHADDGDVYSPAEVRSIDAIHFDAADTTRLHTSSLTASAARVFRRGRQAEVNIESDVPSVPTSPLGYAQESVRQFSVSAPLPAGAAAPGVPAQSAAELIARYMSKYHGGVEASLHNVLAIMNPASGETGVSQIVLAGLRDELGTQRVLQLTGELFADPAPLRLLIKEQSVIYHPPHQPVRQQRGTVVVCGGDGTVSFIMTQLDLVRRELEAEFQPFLSAAEQQQMEQHRDGAQARRHLPDSRDEGAHPFFTIPALAPLPLGTGNDYSNCVGFGKGFSPRGSGCCGLCALFGCEDGVESQVAAALLSAVSAPCVTFDRWEVSLVPLQVAQRFVRRERTSPLRAASSFSASVSQRRDGAGGNTPPVAPAAHASPPSSTEMRTNASVSSPLASSVRERERSVAWSRTARPSNVASAVNVVDWDAIYDHQEVSTYGLINYLSVGYDAYVAGKFDETRRAYPTVCSTRTQNKAVYVSLGIGGAMRCKKLRKLIPMVCVPRPVMPGDVAPAPLSFHAPPSPSFRAAAEPSAGERELVALQLPSMTKSLVISNVSCYGAGTHPWNPQGGELYYRPVTLRNGELVASPVITTPDKEEVPLPVPPPRPVTINDRTFEVQTMGGILHYSSLGVGLSSSTKLLQTGEMFAFVLCTPEDLYFPSGQCSTYTRINLKDKYESRISTDLSVQASLSVQIDGEPMPSITEPTIVHVRRQHGSRILVRCRNSSVVQ